MCQTVENNVFCYSNQKSDLSNRLGKKGMVEMKRALILISVVMTFALCACGQQGQTLSGLYTPVVELDYGDDTYAPWEYGYVFDKDGTVTYSETNFYWWADGSLHTKCSPKFWRGTYAIEDKALTITISGIATPMTGVLPSTPGDPIYINGLPYVPRTTPYNEEVPSHESWAELDKNLGLSS